MKLNKLEMKPISVNAAFSGIRHRTKEYNLYVRNLMVRLPDEMEIPGGKLHVNYEFGVSSSTDWDNLIKPFQDVLQKKYGFNDSRIYSATVKKISVSRGKEFIKFRISKHEED